MKQTKKAVQAILIIFALVVCGVFHEVVDEMKLREPDYPEGLKVEFLRLCKGKEREQTVPEKKFGSNIKRFFKKILPADKR